MTEENKRLTLTQLLEITAALLSTEILQRDSEGYRLYLTQTKVYAEKACLASARVWPKRPETLDAYPDEGINLKKGNPVIIAASYPGMLLPDDMWIECDYDLDEKNLKFQFKQSNLEADLIRTPVCSGNRTWTYGLK